MTRIIDRETAGGLCGCLECIDMMREVQRLVSDGQCAMLERGLIPFSNGNSLAVMPAGMESFGITGAKLAIFAGPETKKKHTQQGIIPLFSTEDGSLAAIVEAEMITVLRTAAVSAMATDCLARKEAHTLCVIGAGRLAYMHILFISKIRTITKVYLHARGAARAQALAERVTRELGIEAVVCREAAEAAGSADIVCTVTNAKEPVLRGEWLRPGTHVNAVGACKRTAREVDTDVIKNCRVFVDSRKAALQDAGDILIPMERGEVDETVITGEIGEVVAAGIAGRRSLDEKTLFESVGLPVQDLIMAYRIFQKACKNNAGIEIQL